jgi:hypothetical protein
VNIAIILLIVNFNLAMADKDELFFGFLPILNGNYSDFTVQWYFKIGATLCFTLCINIFSPHASKLLKPVFICCKRCKDRGCRCDLKKTRGDACCDEVNTKLIMQSDL